MINEIKKAYAAMLMSNLQAKNAGIRTRLQPWQISTAMNTMVQDFAQMDAFEQQGLQANQAAFNLPAVPSATDVDSRVTQLETVTHDNNKILARILEKVGD